jgi:hypothetical protein
VEALAALCARADHLRELRGGDAPR